jgi:hypothetical protein
VTCTTRSKSGEGARASNAFNTRRPQWLDIHAARVLHCMKDDSAVDRVGKFSLKQHNQCLIYSDSMQFGLNVVKFDLMFMIFWLLREN